MTDVKDIENTISYEVEGPEADDGHLELSVFLKQVSLFHKLLTGSVKNSEHKGVKFRVVSLSHSSPATVTCQGVGSDKRPSPVAISTVKKILNAVHKNKTNDLDNECLSVVEKLMVLSPKIARHRISIAEEGSYDGLVYELDDEFRVKLSRARDEEHTDISTVGGILEAVNIHHQPYTFNIYDSGLGSAAIQCQFEDWRLEQVQDALGHNVYVRGRCFYRPNKSIPYKMTDISKIEKLPPADELPSLTDIKGIAPGLTGGKASEDFVRESRKQWGKTDK